MEEIALYLRIVLAVLFITTAWSKFGKMGEHIGIVEDYRIVPKALAPLFARVETYVETGLGVLLLVGLWQPWVALASCLLLLLYTVAITINLLRGRHEISCGCGGAAGNHQLSWWLTLRNLVLIGSGYTVYAVHTPLASLDAMIAGGGVAQVLSVQSLIMSTLAVLTIIIWMKINLLHDMDNHMHALWERKS